MATQSQINVPGLRLFLRQEQKGLFRGSHFRRHWGDQHLHPGVAPAGTPPIHARGAGKHCLARSTGQAGDRSRGEAESHSNFHAPLSMMGPEQLFSNIRSKTSYKPLETKPDTQRCVFFLLGFLSFIFCIISCCCFLSLVLLTRKQCW